MTARITEWQPTSLRSIPGILFFASALAVVVLIARRGRADPVADPRLARRLLPDRRLCDPRRGLVAARRGRRDRRRAGDRTGRRIRRGPKPSGSPLMRRLNLVVAGAIVVAGVALLPVWRPIDPASTRPPASSATRRPGSPRRLRDTAGPTDRLFNPQPWGSWFEFALPDLPVAIDSRIELFPAATWDTYENIVAGGEGWAAQLDDWGVTIDRRRRARRPRWPTGWRPPAGARSTRTTTARSWSRRIGRRPGRSATVRPQTA